MLNAAFVLTNAIYDITSPMLTQQKFAQFEKYLKASQNFVSVGITLAGLLKDTDMWNQIVTGLKSVSDVSNNLLMTAKSVNIDRNMTEKSNMLNAAR